MVKLIRLRSVANNAVRSSIWTLEGIVLDPFEHIKPRETFTVDLIKGAIMHYTKEGKEELIVGDDIEKYYTAMSEWFHQALEKERIALNIIESAIIYITPDYKQCIIIAGGKTFKSAKIGFDT